MRTSEELIKLVEENISDFHHKDAFVSEHGAEVYQVIPEDVMVVQYKKVDTNGK